MTINWQSRCDRIAESEPLPRLAFDYFVEIGCTLLLLATVIGIIYWRWIA